jgi:hypothetical protein
MTIHRPTVDTSQTCQYGAVSARPATREAQKGRSVTRRPLSHISDQAASQIVGWWALIPVTNTPQEPALKGASGGRVKV